MFELGAESAIEHQKLILSLQNEVQIQCYFVGNEFYQNKIKQSNFSFFKTFEDFSNVFSTKKPQNALLLIKGSRGMALERTLELL